MKALVCRRYGSLDALELVDVPRPSPGRGEVLVAVKAASINDWDWGIVRGSPWIMRLAYGLVRPSRVAVLGCDVAGRVAATGDGVSSLHPGDDVYGDLCRSGFGAFAEYACVPERALVRTPPGMSYVQAAALPQAGMLAVQALGDGAPLRPGQRLLLNGAGGGVGTLAIQLVRDLDLDITAVDKGSKLGMLRELGAHRVVDYQQEDFTTAGGAYDLIVDVHTDRWPLDYARVLAPGGRYVTVGGSVWRMLQILALRRHIARRQHKRLHIVSLVPNRDLAALGRRFEAGDFAPVVEPPVPLERFHDAFARFVAGEQQGKIVLTIG